jgi:hypothetical protein
MPLPQLNLPVPQLSSPTEHGTDLPLPCHYFDFIVGTSTGGLVNPFMKPDDSRQLTSIRLGSLPSCLGDYA